MAVLDPCKPKFEAFFFFAASKKQTNKQTKAELIMNPKPID